MEVRTTAESEKKFGASGHTGEKNSAENTLLESIGIYSPQQSEKIIADKILAFLRKLNQIQN